MMGGAMTAKGDNGHNLVEDSGRDDAGRFVDGHQKLGGRPKGTMDLMAICRRKAKETGHSMETAVWLVMRSMFRSAVKGDSTAQKNYIDRTCGVMEKALIEVDARTVVLPQAPTGEALGTWAKRLLEIAEEEGA